MKVAIIGNGNVAHHLAPALRGAGLAHGSGRRNYEVVQITTDINELTRTADIYFLLVPDDALYEIAQRLRLPQKTVVHVSGMTPLATIMPISDNVGVMYFVQTFSKDAPLLDFGNIPVCSV
jgi:3-hydroxyisobutyrate dehydrogenase-like beta-hydroxyacid dehydrogenase